MINRARLADARQGVQADAARRWAERADIRRRAMESVAANGPGAADTPQRRRRFVERMQKMVSRGMVGGIVDSMVFPERIIGDPDFNEPTPHAVRAGRPVARLIDMPERTGIQPTGFATGFLISSDGLLITNNHVFAEKGHARGVGANFLHEKTAAGIQAGVIFELDPDRLFVTDERLDFTIVAVKQRGTAGESLSDYGCISMTDALPKILVGQDVNIIQHPGGGYKKYATDANTKLVDLLDDFFHYETDTLEGSSGSPGFSDAWELVVLHHAGIPMIRDGKVINTKGEIWDKEQGDDNVRWIANEGTRVSVIVQHLSKLPLPDPAQRGVLDALMRTTIDPIYRAGESSAAGAAGAVAGGTTGVIQPLDFAGGRMANNQFNFSGPVTIHVYAPPAAVPVTTPAPNRTTAAPEKVIQFDPDYDGRRGYEPEFLSTDAARIVVPVPTIPADRLGDILLTDRGAPLVLKYHHFELVMNKSRRLQAWSAVNVDYDAKRKSTRDRKEFGSDKWIPDPRIEEAYQIVGKEFYDPAKNIDQGHIVRREDNAWGDSEREIEYANADTFHRTNCTPQHEAFNQSDPARNDRAYRGMHGLWGEFENHVQKSRNLDDTKLCILAGPVLRDNDPSQDFGFGAIQYPLSFWKVVCIADTDTDTDGDATPTLKAYGFVLSHKDVVDRFGIESFVPGPFKRYQKKLTEIETLAGINFDDALHDADQK